MTFSLSPSPSPPQVLEPTCVITFKQEKEREGQLLLLGSGYFADTSNVNFDLILPVMHCAFSDQAWPVDVEASSWQPISYTR